VEGVTKGGQELRGTIKSIGHKFGLEISRVKRPLLDYSPYNDFPPESLRRKRFYNVGAGKFAHPCWTNLDCKSEHYQAAQTHPFVEFDLMRLEPLPIEDNTAEIIYSSHCIEHVNDPAVLNLLKESHRALKPNGCLRLTTPDMELFYGAYVRNDIDFWYWRGRYDRASIHQLFLSHFAGQLSEINPDNSAHTKYTDDEIKAVFSTLEMTDAFEFFSGQCVYNPKHAGNHINHWTHDKVFSFLHDAGFSQCNRSAYGQSSSPPLRDTTLFDNTHPRISLYVESFKEGTH